MPTPKLTKEMVAAAILGFEAEKRGIDAQMAELRAFLSGEPAESAPTPVSTKLPRRKISAAGRKAMAEAQRKRWAAIKRKPEPQASATSATPTATPSSKAAPKPKRKLSAAGRAAIIAATKKMWAAKRAAAKK
jgi:hypothetical protein